MAAVSPTLLAALTIGIVALVLGIFIGMYTIPPQMTPENAAIVKEYKRLTKNYFDVDNDEDPVYRALINGPDRESIRKNIQLLSVKPHQAGTKRDEELAQVFKNTFLEAGLDRAYLVPYKVLLSYADPERPNRIYLNDKSTDAVLVVSHQEPPLRPDDGNVPSYNGYSPNGDIIGEPVYCNYGMVEDFELLEDEARIDLTGKICLIRYGRTFRGNKLANAERFGCAAVIFFSDPSSMAPFGTATEQVYPNSIWMNGKAMQSGHTRLDLGDPLTPGYPSIVDGYREDLNDDERVHLPKIPSQPIGYDDAKMILSHMTGESTDDNIKFQKWTGKLNITYRLGPGFQSPSQELRMVINNELVEKTVYNVIGVLDGQLEPDRYVLVGNHRDAWSYGAMDAASGGAPMLESAKAFGRFHKETGWRPRRSLVFASWAAEELGCIGSVEWTEQFRQLLDRQAVAYINVDTCVYGPVFNSDATPSLAQVLRDATKRVPAHKIEPDEELTPNQTLFDSWLNHNGENHKELPVEILSSGSDHVPFAFGNGIPSINLHFKHDKKKYPVSGYPAYHTGYETFHLVKSFIDPDFSIHQTCSRLINVILYSLSCSTFIPFNFIHLSKQIFDDYEQQQMDKQLKDAFAMSTISFQENTANNGNQSIKYLYDSMKMFQKATVRWHEETIDNFNTSDPIQIRMANNIIMQVERSFADRPLYKRPDTKNLLYGAVSHDQYQTSLFPGLLDIIQMMKFQQSQKVRKIRLTHEELNEIEKQIQRLQRTLRRHLNDISLALRNAAKLLESFDEKII